LGGRDPAHCTGVGGVAGGPQSHLPMPPQPPPPNVAVAGLLSDKQLRTPLVLLSLAVTGLYYNGETEKERK